MSSSPLEKGIIDIITFHLGLRPLLTEESLRALVRQRFEQENL